MIEFRGTIDAKLYMRSISLHGGSLRVVAIACAVVGLLGIRGLGTTALALAGVGLALLLVPWLVARNTLRTSALLRTPFTGHLDDVGFHAESANGQSNIAWPLFYRGVVQPDVILLYVSSRQFLILSRAFFAGDAEWAAAQELVRGKVSLKRPLGLRLLLFGFWILIVVLVWALIQIATAP